MTTIDELIERIAELEAAQAAATGWGAAVGAREEELRGLRRRLAQLQSKETSDA